MKLLMLGGVWKDSGNNMDATGFSVGGALKSSKILLITIDMSKSAQCLISHEKEIGVT